MTFQVRDEANALVEVGAAFARDGDNVLTEIAAMLVRDEDGLHEVFSNLSSAFDVDVPPDVYGAGASNSHISISTSSATATITGGQAPYTYQWTRTDVGPDTWVILSPTAQKTAFRCNGVPPGDFGSATFIVTVTDARGTDVASSEISAMAENFGSLGGGPIP